MEDMRSIGSVIKAMFKQLCAIMIW